MLCNELFGWDDRHAFGDLKEIVDDYWGISPRHAYQTLGTEWGRKLINDQLWVMKAQRELEKRQFMVVPDIRFDNEVEWLRKNDGLLVLVQRGTTSITDPKNLAHASERGVEHHIGLFPRDIIIPNVSSVEALAHSVEWLLKNDPEYQKNVVWPHPAAKKNPLGTSAAIEG